jgi:hypothetical protein
LPNNNIASNTRGRFCRRVANNNKQSSNARAVLEYETAQQQLTRAETKLAVHQARLQFITLGYRLGEGNMETMLQWWQTETELQQEVEQAKVACHQRLTSLQTLVVPSSSSTIPNLKPSSKVAPSPQSTQSRKR